MDSDSWVTRVSTFSRHPSGEFCTDDAYFGVCEESDLDDELRAEFLCPFCADDFDFVGLCCHIDEEHAAEAKNGVCPVCAKRVGLDLVGHLTMQHGSLLKVQRKKRFHRGGSNSASYILRKELQEANLQSLLGGTFVPSSAEPDRLLASFISNMPVADEQHPVQPVSSVDTSSKKVSSAEESVEREVQRSQVSDKEQAEKARKSEFVQGLILSTFLDDGL